MGNGKDKAQAAPIATTPSPPPQYELREASPRGGEEAKAGGGEGAKAGGEAGGLEAAQALVTLLNEVAMKVISNGMPFIHNHHTHTPSPPRSLIFVCCV